MPLMLGMYNQNPWVFYDSHLYGSNLDIFA